MSRLDFRDEDCAVPQATRQPDLLTGLDGANSSSRERRQHQVYAADRARLMVGSYRWTTADDPQTYAQAIAMVLESFPRSIIEWATDPRTGIQAEEKFRSFAPNAGELKAFCDAEMHRVRQNANPPIYRKPRHYVAPSREPGCWARVFVPADSTHYQAALAWKDAKGRDEREWRIDNIRGGIWVTLRGWEEEIRGGRSLATWRAPSNAELVASLARASRTQPRPEINDGQ